MIILLYLILLYMFAIACSLRDCYTAASLTKMRFERKKEGELAIFRILFKRERVVEDFRCCKRLERSFISSLEYVEIV